MNEELSLIHDNTLLSYTVDSGSREVILRTRSEDGTKDITFTFKGVVAYVLENDSFGTIFFGIDEVDPTELVRENWKRIEEGFRLSGWLAHWEASFEKASAQIQNESLRGYEIGSSIGMSGWVLAKSVSAMISDGARS